MSPISRSMPETLPNVETTSPRATRSMFARYTASRSRCRRFPSAPRGAMRDAFLGAFMRTSESPQHRLETPAELGVPAVQRLVTHRPRAVRLVDLVEAASHPLLSFRHGRI